MVDFDAMDQASARQILTALGRAATYRPQGGDPVTTVAVVERDVALTGGLGEVVERVTAAELLVADVRTPARGDLLTVGEASWQVREIASNDGVVVRVVLR